MFVLFLFVTTVSSQAHLLNLEDNSSSGTSVMVSFTQSMTPVFFAINNLNFSSDVEKRTALTQHQEAFANHSQGPLKAFLASSNVKYESFWINNKIIVPNANSELINAMYGIPGVARVEPEPEVQLLNSISNFEISEINLKRSARAIPSWSTWGIQWIRADQAWKQGFTGKGVVVATIDSGVRPTHESMRDNRRKTHSWYDPYWGSKQPVDQLGHGTNTMGLLAGTNGIGVAPESTWITCRGFGGKTRTPISKVLGCTQWIQCPSQPDGSDRRCDLAPKVVSNSYLSAGFEDVIRSWKNAGIIPVFAIGNDGPNCNTTRPAGNNPNVIGAGYTDYYDRIGQISSRGPYQNRIIKPDIVAPGQDVYTAAFSSDNAYSYVSGSSYASPHVAGVIALMMQKNPGLKYDQVYSAITKSAQRNLNTEGAQGCGGISATTYPNHVFGYGKVDVIGSLQFV